MNKRIRKKRSWYGYPDWYVRKVIPQDDYTLLITYRGGKRGIFDLKPFLDNIAAPLKENKELYLNPTVGGGMIYWGKMGEVSIAPEYIYEHSQPVTT